MPSLRQWRHSVSRRTLLAYATRGEIRIPARAAHAGICRADAAVSADVLPAVRPVAESRQRQRGVLSVRDLQRVRRDGAGAVRLLASASRSERERGWLALKRVAPMPPGALSAGEDGDGDAVRD